MPTISQAMALAVQHHRAGRLKPAAEVYRRVLDIEPEHVAAWHLLGVVLHQTGQHAAAVEHIQRAIQLGGGDAAMHSNLGEAYRALGHTAQAITHFQRGLELDPAAAEIHYNLGNVLKALRRRDEAVASYRRALVLAPRHVQAWNNLGNTLRDQECLAEAVDCYRRALQLQPDFAEALSNLGIALSDLGQGSEALACGRRAVQLKPADATAWCNLGNAQRADGQPEDALASYRRALVLKPDFPEAHYNMGFALQEQGQLTAAIEALQQAVRLRPDYGEAHNNLGVVLRDAGQVPESLDAFGRAVEVEPEHTSAHSNLVFTLHYQPGITPQALADAHAEFDRRHAVPLRAAWHEHGNSRDPERPLRLGFVSPDFRRHPVGYFLIGPFENLDGRQCHTVCYADQRKGDDLTARFQAAAGQWRSVRGLSDAALAEQIRADRIDVLFDLAGHTAHNRLLVFARKPAPVQITWLGYEGTTGLSAMDYLLADRFTVPPEGAAGHRESVLRMPDGSMCYTPLDDAPPVSPLPAVELGAVTLASFNNLAKIGPAVVALWARVLAALPKARLLMMYRGLGDAAVQERYRRQFADFGVAPERLLLRGPVSYAEYLATYREVDLLLDPFPFAGGATTCDALWMGVPVITCPGQTFASRHSLSHLTNVGLRETIARDFDEYIHLAVSLAHDLPRLAAVRAGLRQQMAASPLCDGQRFARHLQAILRDVWRQWCARSGVVA